RGAGELRPARRMGFARWTRTRFSLERRVSSLPRRGRALPRAASGDAPLRGDDGAQPVTASLNTINPERPTRDVVDVSNPSVSEQTGRPTGFWWSEPPPPYWDGRVMAPGCPTPDPEGPRRPARRSSARHISLRAQAASPMPEVLSRPAG